MKIGACISVGLASLAAGLIYFWSVGSDSISSPGKGIAVTDQIGTLSERVGSTPDAVEESVDSDSDQTEPAASSEASDSPLVRRQQDMAKAIYRLGGTRVVQRLVESGLAPSDSDEIARRYAEEVAACAMASLRTEAARQSMSLDELMAELAGAARGGGDPFDVVDRSRLEANALPCEADAMQRAGIPYGPDTLISEEEAERLRKCFEELTSSDVAGSVILETCTSEVFGDVP